jgi:hypothetical protein
MKKIKSVKSLLIKKCSNRKLGYSKRKTKEQKSLWLSLKSKMIKLEALIPLCRKKSISTNPCKNKYRPKFNKD